MAADDYTFSYNFYLDGSVEFLVMASGYIQAAYYAQNDEYGYRIHDGLSGSMHDHSCVSLTSMHQLVSDCFLHPIFESNRQP